MKILFICTGNTCRSPMIEAIFNNMVQSDGMYSFTSISRGVSVYNEESINLKAVEALKTLGISNVHHVSQQVTNDDMKSADLVLTMTQMQKIMLHGWFKDYKYKTATLLEYARDSRMDIDDPFGKSQVVYNLCAADMSKCVNELLERLKEDYPECLIG